MNSNSHKYTTTAFVVHRTLSVPGMNCNNCEQTILTTLSELDGVLEITTNLPRKRVRIKYDAAVIGFDALAQSFADAGYPLENNLWTRFRYGLYRFTDSNAYANSRVPASPCCSNPTGIYAKKQK